MNVPDTALQKLVQQRRKAIGGNLPAIGGADVWGLALSGGGIRSATFCFGLLHALAAQGLLLRFDLLSTVSGGGYIGATLGRLLGRARSFAEVDRVLDALSAGNVAWFCQWLRANGRYLTPRGLSDRFFAAAVYTRNMVSVHIELGVIGLGLGAGLTLVDLIFWAGLDRVMLEAQGIQDMPLWRDWIAWLPTAWLLVLPFVVAGLVLGLAFQAIALVSDSGKAWFGVLVGCIFTIALLLLFKRPIIAAPNGIGADARKLIWWTGVVFAIGWLAALAVARVVYTRADTAMRSISTAVTAIDVQDAARSATTKHLAFAFKAIFIVALLGLVDRAAWWLAYGDVSWKYAGWALSAMATALRAVLPQLARLRASAGSSNWLLTLGGLLGRLLTFGLLVWWVAVVHRTVMSPIFTPRGVVFAAAAMPLALLILACVLYALLTGFDTRFVNASSLHGFYRARLIRSYLGAANGGRFGLRGDPTGAADAAPVDWMTAGASRVSDVDPDDDVHICDYKPHAHGGPVHLINVCVNETRDPRGGLFNEDRRGRLATIAPTGLLRVGQGDWRQLEHEDGSLTLGSWIAISGAAVAPGMGGKTRGGLAALAMFAGARLGYWWNSRVLMLRQQPGGKNVPQPNLFRPKMFGKSRALVRETTGEFDVGAARTWFLSDGGHFENTGAYALLAERAKVIVIADCGADPNYRFQDLENLVRKARIDLRCDITFLKPVPKEAIGAPQAAANSVAQTPHTIDDYGSLNDLVSSKSQTCLALARITYVDDGSEGHIILVKPNLCGGLPVDLFNFKAEQPEFPQQSTADQFFDEAQWESYFQLGTALGEKLSPASVSPILANSRQWFVEDDGSPVNAAQETKRATQTPATAAAESTRSRLPARIAANAVGATLGLGAVSALAVGSWQGIEAVRSMIAQQRETEHAALKEIVDLWGKVPRPDSPSRGDAVGALAGALARASENLCSADQQGWFNRSDLAVQILGETRAACKALKSSAPPSCSYLLSVTSPNAIATHATCLASGITESERKLERQGCSAYWGYDYSAHAHPRCGHRNLTIVAAAIAREQAANGGFRLSEPQYAPSLSLEFWHPYDSLLRLLDAPAGDCFGEVIRPMLYGRSREADAAALTKRWTALGADVTGAIDVAAKAAFEGRPPPSLVRKSTIQFVEGEALNCARKIAASDPASEFQLLPETPERLARGTITVWLTDSNSDRAAAQLHDAVEAAASAPANPTIRQAQLGPLAVSLPVDPDVPPVNVAAVGDPAGSSPSVDPLRACVERAICVAAAEWGAQRHELAPSKERTRRKKATISKPPPESECPSGEMRACVANPVASTTPR